MNPWFQAARPLAHANIAPPLVLGQALAYALEGDFDLRIAVLVHLFGAFDHLYIVFANDAADWETDVANTTFGRFSGGSRVVPEGLLTPRQLAHGALLAVMGMAAVSFYLVFVKLRLFMVVAAALAVGLLWAYSFPPLKLSYRGHGEWLQGVGVGVVLPLVGYHAQSARILGIPWALLFGGFLLGWAGNLVTALPDAPSDAASGKRTFVVRRGARAARLHALGAVAVAATLMASSVVASAGARALTAGLCMLPLVVAIPLSKDAEAAKPQACERFVFLVGGAITAAWLGTSALLIAST